jgi:hypothetical protein
MNKNDVTPQSAQDEQPLTLAVRLRLGAALVAVAAGGAALVIAILLVRTALSS